MKRDFIDFIHDMLNSINELTEFTDNVSYETFENSKILRLSTERLLEILGKAANRIPVELQEKYPSITWRDIIGMRNIIIHSYDKVDPKQLWNVIKFRLKSLKDDLNNMITELEK